MINFIKNHKLITLFIIVFIIHIIAVFAIYYTNFLSHLGGTSDSVIYHKSAIEISGQFKEGNFLLKGITQLYPDVYLTHFYPIVVAIIYTIFPPNIIFGELFNAFLCAFISIFAYLIVIELGESSTKAFIVGIIISLYPSLVLNGSLLLKDALVVCLSIAALLLIVKLIKKFKFWQFALLYFLLIPIINLRFYLGYALMLSFIICWFLFCKNIKFKKRIFYIIIIILLFGFLPEISNGQGYWGIKSFQYYFNPKTITYYRESVYNAPDLGGSGSTLNLKTDFEHPAKFLINYSESFIYVLFGPFPWQMKYLRQFLALFETIPWYFLFYFIARGIINAVRNKNTPASALIVFSVMFLAVVALFDSNFGLFMRIRMPAFISLLCLLPFGLNSDYINKFNNYISKFTRLNNFAKQN